MRVKGAQSPCLGALVIISDVHLYLDVFQSDLSYEEQKILSLSPYCFLSRTSMKPPSSLTSPPLLASNLAAAPSSKRQLSHLSLPSPAPDSGP